MLVQDRSCDILPSPAGPCHAGSHFTLLPAAQFLLALQHEDTAIVVLLQPL